MQPSSFLLRVNEEEVILDKLCHEKIVLISCAPQYGSHSGYRVVLLIIFVFLKSIMCSNLIDIQGVVNNTGTEDAKSKKKKKKAYLRC